MSNSYLRNVLFKLLEGLKSEEAGQVSMTDLNIKDKSDFLVDIPEGNVDVPAYFLVKELEEFIQAVDCKKEHAQKIGKPDLVPILNEIYTDMQRTVNFYKEGELSFNQCYEEIVSLYVFTELYFVNLKETKS